MSRQIIFRGKLLTEDKWVYGYLTSLISIRVFLTDEWEGQYEDFFVDPNTVGMFTGLSDKNATDIYEGDIIDSSMRFCEYGVVKFKNGSFISFVKEQEDVLLNNLFDIIIVGNIYKNPKLSKLG